jgi:hypothetical protein
MKNGIRSYNSFLKSAKSREGLSHKQAQQLYRDLKERIGERPTRLTFSKHPKIAKEEASLVKHGRTTGPNRVSGRNRRGAGGGGGAGGVNSVYDYLDQFDTDDYGYDEYDSSAEYE